MTKTHAYIFAVLGFAVTNWLTTTDLKLAAWHTIGQVIAMYVTAVIEHEFRRRT